MRSTSLGGFIKSMGSGKSLCKFLVVIRKKVKPRLGLAGEVLFKANYQEGPINPHGVRDAKSRNKTPI